MLMDPVNERAKVQANVMSILRAAARTRTLKSRLFAGQRYLNKTVGPLVLLLRAGIVHSLNRRCAVRSPGTRRTFCRTKPLLSAIRLGIRRRLCGAISSSSAELGPSSQAATGRCCGYWQLGC